MKKKNAVRITIMICLAAILQLAAAGCAGPSDSGRQAARINDTIITEGDLDTYTALKLYRTGYDPSSIEKEQKEECLKEMINAEIVRQYYESNGTEIYDDFYNAGKETFLEEMQSTDKEFLEQNGITNDKVIGFYRAQFVLDRFFEETRALHSEEEISAEAQEEYQEHLDEYIVEKEKRISMILLKKKKQAEEVIDRLNNGEDFGSLAQEVSIDENSRAVGGDLGFFRRQDLRDRFGKGIFGMEVGEYTDSPVKTKDGYAVIRIIASHDSGYLSYDEVAQDIMYSLYEGYNDRRIQEIRENMDVEEER